MDKSLALVIISAKEINKLVHIKYSGLRPHATDLLKLKHNGLILVKGRSPDGILIKLTLMGYHHFK